MSLNLLQIVVLFLATNQAVEIWHHSSLFARLRARLEMLDGSVGLGKVWQALIDLLLCPWCLSVWVALGWYLAWSMYPPVRWLMYALAISKAANIAADFQKTHLRRQSDPTIS